MCTERNYLCNGVMYFPSLKSCKRGIVPGETPCPWSMLGAGNRTQITRLVMSTEVVHIEWLASFASLVRLFADCSASKRIACTGGGVERFQVFCMWPKCRKNIEHANYCNQLLHERADRMSHGMDDQDEWEYWDNLQQRLNHRIKRHVELLEYEYSNSEGFPCN